MLFEKSNAANFGNRTRQILEIKRVKFYKSKVHLTNQTPQTLEIKIVIREMKRDNKKQRIFPFNHRQDIKIIEDKKRIRHSKFYL